MQYSKFNNPEYVVRDVSSTAQAICLQDLESGYFSHQNVTLYFSAALVLPLATSVVSTVTLWKYHGVIKSKLDNESKRPIVIGMVMTGIYITLYILSVDAAAIYYYITRKNEYGMFDSIYQSFSLQLTWLTWVAEHVSATLVLLVFWCLREYKCRTGFSEKSIIFKCFIKFAKKLILACIITPFISMFVYFITNFVLVSSTTVPLFYPVVVISHITLLAVLAVFYFSNGCDEFLMCFTAVPVIFVSAHIDYIFAAWLTEPSKTTSVAILAIALIFYLFIMSRSLYKFIKDVLRKVNIQSESVAMTFTFVLGLFGVGIAALQVASFYTLPIPAIKLADYLDNVFQISLVILAALISYKIISTEDSEASKFFKKFNKAYKATLPSQNSSVMKSLKLEAKLSAKFSYDQITVSTSQKNQRIATAKLTNTTLLVRIRPDHEKYIIVPTSEVSLEFATFTAVEKEVYVSLASAKLSFKLLSAFKPNCVTVSLKEASLDGESVSNFELRLFTDDNQYGAILAKSSILCDTDDIIEHFDKTLSVFIPCHIAKRFISQCNEGAFCRFDNSLNVTVRNYSMFKTWDGKVIGQTLLPLTNASIDIEKNEQGHEYYLKIGNGNILCSHFCGTAVPIKVKRHNITLKYSLAINDGSIKLSFETRDGHDYMIVDHYETERLSVPTAHLRSEFVVIKMEVGQQTRWPTSSTISFDNNTNIQLKDDLIIRYGGQVNRVHRVRFCTQDNTEILSRRFQIGNPQVITLKNICLICIQRNNGDSDLEVQNIVPNGPLRFLHVKLKKDNVNTKIKLPFPLSNEHKLDLVTKDLENRASSFLFFPNTQSSLTQDEFETAGVTCGEVALTFSREKRDTRVEEVTGTE